MSSRTRLRSFGRAILMGSAIGVGVVGCTLPEAGAPQTEQQNSQLNLEYNHALTSRDAGQVTKFVQTYPNSSDAARLLNQMPPEVLANVPRYAVVGMSESVKRQLAPRVRGQFGVFAEIEESGRGGDTSSGGYGG